VRREMCVAQVSRLCAPRRDGECRADHHGAFPRGLAAGAGES